MGKYIDLVRQVEELNPQEKDVDSSLDNTNKHSIVIDTMHTALAPVELPVDNVTRLRGYAVNAVVPCIHGTTADACAVCSGYARWLIADERRLTSAQRDPEAARREFWRSFKGGA